MNHELEKLVNYALVDGYLTDKEKQVLLKKAQSNGFDTDELEMILEGKLFEINRSNKSIVNKCPSCGEIMSGLSKVCSSCDYVISSEIAETESVSDAVRRLEESVFALKAVPQPGTASTIKSVLLIIFSSGLYIIYKKLIKREALFDRYEKVNQKVIAVTDMQVRSLQTKYGEDEKINKYVNDLIKERDTIISKRYKSDAISAIATFAITAIVMYGLILFSDLQSKKDAIAKAEAMAIENEVSTELKNGNVSKANQALDKMKDGEAKEKFKQAILFAEIDSLANAGDYDDALKVIDAQPDYDSKFDKRDQADIIIEKQVDDLIAKKEFSVALSKALKADFTKRDELMEKISAAETAYNKAKAAARLAKKTKRNRKR